MDLGHWPQKMLDEHGWTADDFMAMTPYAFAAMFLGKSESEKDKVLPVDLGQTTEAVKLFNDLYRTPKGLRPYIPNWFLKNLAR